MNTELKVPVGGSWVVEAPDGVTITPTNNADNTAVVALDIKIDYTGAANPDVVNDISVGIHFQGPEPKPLEAPVQNTSYPGLVVPTTIEVTNHTGGLIDGYMFWLTDDDNPINNPDLPAKNPNFRNPQDLGNAHPDDYAHFHNVTKTSLVDDATKTPNALVTVVDPNGNDGAFGSAHTPAPGVHDSAPDLIRGDGTIAPGAVEKLVGLAANGGVTVHSEDKPGEFGGSFTLYFKALHVGPATIDTHELDRQMLLDSLHNPDLLPTLKTSDGPTDLSGLVNANDITSPPPMMSMPISSDPTLPMIMNS